MVLATDRSSMVPGSESPSHRSSRYGQDARDARRPRRSTPRCASCPMTSSRSSTACWRWRSASGSRPSTTRTSPQIANNITEAARLLLAQAAGAGDEGRGRPQLGRHSGASARRCARTSRRPASWRCGERLTRNAAPSRPGPPAGRDCTHPDRGLAAAPTRAPTSGIARRAAGSRRHGSGAERLVRRLGSVPGPPAGGARGRFRLLWRSPDRAVQSRWAGCDVG